MKKYWGLVYFLENSLWGLEFFATFAAYMLRNCSRSAIDANIIALA